MRPTLGRWIDLAAQLEQDAAREPDALRRRDRALGRELAARDPDTQVAAWLDRVAADGESLGQGAERAGRVLGVLLAAAGLVLGAATAVGVFWYDGTHPVNAVRVLAVFVALQLALLLATALLCLPASWRAAIPGLAAVQETLALLSPGRWQAGFARLLPEGQQRAAARLSGLVQRHRALYGDVEKWRWLAGSQAFGTAFHAAALATALALVAFTDLAFGWSTTLDVSAERLHAITAALSRPWAAFAPAAVPSSELIEATRYFRESTGHDPEASAPWWRFLLAAMAVYGLLPRFAFWIFARLRLALAVRRAFRAVPGLAALRDRLESRLVETVAEAADPEAPGLAAAPEGEGAASLSEDVRCAVLVWSGFPLTGVEAASAALGVEVTRVERAGEAGLAEDALAIRALVAGGGDDPLVIVAKAWEPPVLELLDFLGELREALGSGRGIVVVPLALTDDGGVRAPEPGDAVQWRRAIDRLGDPWTSVKAVARS